LLLAARRCRSQQAARSARAAGRAGGHDAQLAYGHQAGRDRRRDGLRHRAMHDTEISADDGTEGLFGSRHRALTIGLVSIVTLVAFESLAVITILPDVEADLQGIAWYGWVTTAFFLGTMTGTVFAGGQRSDERRGGIEG